MMEIIARQLDASPSENRTDAFINLLKTSTCI